MWLRVSVALSGTCDREWAREATRCNAGVTAQSRETQASSRLTYAAGWVWSLKQIVSWTAPWFIFISDETNQVTTKDSGSKATLTQGELWGTRTLLWIWAKLLSNTVNTHGMTLLSCSEVLVPWSSMGLGKGPCQPGFLTCFCQCQSCYGSFPVPGYLP